MTVLLVDDDDDDLCLFEDAIKEVNKTTRVLKATNGEQALAVLETETPDFIFLDVNMPIMTGLECLAKIKSTESLQHLDITLVSTSNTLEVVSLCESLGVEFIPKPHRFSELISIVKHKLLE